MAEEKPKGEPVFLKIPATGETITLPGVTSLSSNDELKAAADAWIAKNYKGPALAAPVVARTPAVPFDQTQAAAPTEEISLVANRQPELKAYTPTTITGGIYDALQSGFATLADLIPGFDERRANDYASNILRNIKTGTEGILGIETTERSAGDVLLGRATPEDIFNVGLLALPFAAKPVAAGVRRVAPETSAAIGRFATSPGAVADEIAAAVPETALTPEMAAVAARVAPTPVVPETLVKAKPVELPEAPVAAAAIPEAAIPEAAVAPTPTPELPPAITPERLAEMRTSAEDVLQGMAAGTPEAAPLTGIGSASREKFTLDGPLEAPVAAAAIPEAAIPERIGTMKATNFETPDETKRFLADIAEANKNFPEARRGAMTIEQINDLSKDVDLNQLLGRKVGMPLNAEQIQAAKNVLYQNTDDVVAKAKAWVASGGRDATLLQEATDGLVSNTAFLETLQGASSELGRAMRVLRERPSVDMTLAMKQLLERKADGVPIEDIMQRLATFDDPAKAAEFVSALNKPKFKEKVEEYFVNSLLSGPSTHIYNLSSNLGVVLTTPFEKYAEAGIGAILRTPNRVTVREVNARIAGMLQGAKDGVELAKRAFITEEVQTGKQTVEANRKAIEGRLGRVVRLPNRFLSAQDELFKSMHYRGEIAAQAYTRAAKESAGKTDEFAALYNKYLNDPTEDIKKAAVREAEYRLFQSELGRFGKWVQEGSSKFLPLRILQPFVRTPFNLIKYSAERGPLAPLSDRWRRQIAGTPRERNEALAQLTVGSSVLGTASLLAMDGMMTGAGPADPEERAALLATGWQPYSFKFGDTYIPFQRFDPFSTPLGVIADMYTASDYMTDKEINDVGSTLLFSVASNLAEKTYLQGISNFVDSVLSEGRSVDKAKKFLTDTALGFAPNVLRQTSVAIDPTMREATTLVKKAQDRIPFVRGNDIRVMGTDFNIEAVPERLDVWGDPIVRAPSMTVAGKPLIEQFGAATFNLLSPIKPTRETTDPVKKEVARLGLGIDRPKKEVNLSVNIEGEEKPVKFKIELTDRERRQFTLASGIMAKALIQQDIASPEWQQLDDDQRQKLIKDRMSSSREAFRQLIASRAMERYLSENEDLPPIVK